MLLRFQCRGGNLLRHSLHATAWRQSWRSTASAGNVDVSGDRITIGDIVVPLTKPKTPHLVPHKYGKYIEQFKVHSECTSVMSSAYLCWDAATTNR